MLAIIGAIIELVTLIVKNWFERDADRRKQQEALHAQAAQAIKSGNLSAINSVFDKLHSS